MPVEVAPIIKVDGNPLSAALVDALVAADVDLALNLVGRATLRFVQSGHALTAHTTFALETKVTIAAPDGTALFGGEVTGVSVDQDAERGPALTELTVTIDDPSYKLGRETKTEAYLNRSYSDVITAMASTAGLTADVTSTGDVHPYLLQDGTDLAYLDWVARRCGMVWWVADGKLKLTAPTTSTATTDLELGTSLLRSSVRASGLHTAKVTVTGWDNAQQAAVTHTADTGRASEADLVDSYPGRTSRPGRLGKTAVALGSLSPSTAAEAEQLGSGLLAESVSRVVTSRGTTYVDGRIALGTSVRITNAGDASGTFLVTQVRHTYDSTGFFTHFTSGPIRPEGLVDLLGSSQAPSGGSIAGFLTGLVSSNSDPDNQGRVKVKLPTLGPQIETGWARVVTVGGGPTRGVVFQPEVNDEVLVAFEQGDTRRPVVIGGLFSANKGLPTTDNVDNGAVNFRRIHSRLGHVIELADGNAADQQHILLKTKNGHRIRLGEDKMELEVTNKPVTITNGKATVSFSDAGDVTIEGVNVTIKASGSLKVEGQGGIEAKTSAALKLQGTTLEAKASATGTVEASGPLTLKGATVAIN